MNSQPIYLQQNNLPPDERYTSVLLVEPTPEMYKVCLSCGLETKLDKNIHCVVCAEKNRIYNKLIERR